MNNQKVSTAYKTTVLSILFLCLTLTVIGFTQHNASSAFPWNPVKSFYWFLALITFLFCLFISLNKFLKLSGLLSLTSIFVLIALISGNIWPLLVVAIFCLSSRVLGSFLLKLIGIKDYESNHLNQSLTGAGVFGILVGLLAHFPVNYPSVYGLMLALPLIIFRSEVLSDLKLFAQKISDRESNDYLTGPLSGLIATFAVVHFIYVLMPELGYDSLTLHLLVPSHLFARHQWGFDPSLYSMALIPMLGEWLFSIGYMLSGEVGSRLINLSFTYLMAFQGYRIANWPGCDIRSSKLTALLFLVTPLTFLETNSLHVEAVWGAFILGGIMAVIHLLTKIPTNVSSNLKLGGLFFGIAANAKALTLPILPVLTVLLAFYFRRWFSKKILPILLLSLALFLVIGSIPYMTAWIISGNPVFPYFNNIFKSDFFPLIEFGSPFYGSTGISWDILYKATFDSIRYLEATMGAPGFQWLLLLPASIVIMARQKDNKSLLLLIIALASIAIIFQQQNYLRYIFPLFILLSAFISASYYHFSKAGKIFKYFFGFSISIALVLNIIFFPAATWNYRSLPIKVLLSEDIKTKYLLQRSPVRLAIETVNTINLERSPVAFFTEETFGAGLSANALYPTWYDNKFRIDVDAIKTNQDLANVLSKYNSAYLILDENWGNPQKREIIKANSIEIAKFNYISVRRLADKIRFGTEYLKNSNLLNADGWGINPGASFSPGLAIVSVNSPIQQSVPVHEGRRYRNQIVAKCAQQPTQGRVQINWYDIQGKLIKSDIEVFTCTDSWESYQLEVIAPNGATVAAVYGSSHTDKSIKISKISLR